MTTPRASLRRNALGHLGRVARVFSRREVAAFVLALGVIVTAAVLDLENKGYAHYARPLLAGGAVIAGLLLGHSLRRALSSGRRGRTRGRELPPLPGFERAPVRLAVVGDTGHRPQVAHRVAAAIAAHHAGSPLAAVWLVGDLLDRGESYLDARECHLDEPLAPLLRAGVPLLGVLGNHDHTAGYARELAREPILHMEGRPYYSRTFGPGIVTFFVLDSERLPDEPEQVSWLLGALAGCTSRWRVLVTHHPLVSSEAGHGPDLFRRRMLARALRPGGGIHMVLSGHNHLYERSHHRHGITHLVVGTGSVATSRPLAGDLSRAAESAIKGTWVRLDADPDRLSVRAFAPDGTLVDEFVLGMRPAPFSLPQPVPAGESP